MRRSKRALPSQASSAPRGLRQAPGWRHSRATLLQEAKRWRSHARHPQASSARASPCQPTATQTAQLARIVSDFILSRSLAPRPRASTARQGRRTRMESFVQQASHAAVVTKTKLSARRLLASTAPRAAPMSKAKVARSAISVWAGTRRRRHALVSLATSAQVPVFVLQGMSSFLACHRRAVGVPFCFPLFCSRAAEGMIVVVCHDVVVHRAREAAKLCVCLD